MVQDLVCVATAKDAYTVYCTVAVLYIQYCTVPGGYPVLYSTVPGTRYPVQYPGTGYPVGPARKDALETILY